MINKSENDTIVGVSTAIGIGAIAIIRVSGDEAIAIVDQIFRGKETISESESHRVLYGHVYEDNQIVDEVLVAVFRAPRTYTKENVVEINCHGGVFVTNQIVKCLIRCGCRLASAGEFTKRAFLNGRIDLTKAEAVMDIINAESQNSLKIAHQGLRGDICRVISKKREDLLEMLAIIAVNIDYPEYDDVAKLTNVDILPRLVVLSKELAELIKCSHDAEKIKNGINTVIIGQPNVGKSSILNALLKEERAIVTNIPGTTRDTIESKINLGQITLNLVDTAGIRETKDIVEQIGVVKSQEQINKADLVLLIFDASKPKDQDNLKLIELVKNKKHLIVYNKKDLVSSYDFKDLNNNIYISTFNQEDIKCLENKILDYVFENELNLTNYLYVSNARQIGKLQEAYNAIEEALKEIEQEMYIDFIEMSIKTAWHALGEITGISSPDELLDELFSKFCLGK